MEEKFRKPFGLSDEQKSRVGTGRYKLLLVDDNYTSRTCAESLLRKRGYDVTATADHETARAAVREQTYAAVLLNSETVCGGVDITTFVGELFPELPVIVVGPLMNGIEAELEGQKSVVSLIENPSTPSIEELEIMGQIIEDVLEKIYKSP